MSKSLETVVIGLPWAGTSTVFAILDVLASVGRDWAMLHREQVHISPFRARLCTPDGAAYRDLNGRLITPDSALPDPSQTDLVIVPDMHLDPWKPLPGELKPIAEWVAQVHEAGGMVTSVCSGALLLGQSGVLNGVDATTHWAYSERLAEEFEGIRVRRERVLIPAGDGHRIVTAGGASAWTDLVLYLIAHLIGCEEARRIAKLYLIEPHSQGQLGYASLSAGRQHSDAVIGDLQSWIAVNYEHSNPVQEMARRAGVTERTLLRRFRAATGQTPSDYVQTVRVEEAKQALETSDTPIDEIAGEVGYAEPSAFRTAFKKRVGLSASEYRRKWQGKLHHAFGDAT
ncbi:MAG: helix-turn-helix domain-containing protein [Pseudomonadota bacterium]